MRILEQEILYNFMDTEAFTTIQHAKAAFIDTPSTMGNVVLMLGVLALIVYGINRSRR
jgi:hypothetical protein